MMRLEERSIWLKINFLIKFINNFVGRLSKNKGVDLLLKAMKHFSNNNKIKWKVTICGSGDYENN